MYNRPNVIFQRYQQRKKYRDNNAALIPFKPCVVLLALIVRKGCIVFSATFHNFLIMHLSMSSRQGGDIGRDIGRDFDESLWPGGRAFELSCCPWGMDI